MNVKAVRGFAIGLAVAISAAAMAQSVGYFPPPDWAWVYNGGVVAGSATGGVKGAGTINAQGLYVNGTAVSLSTSTGTVTSVNLTDLSTTPIFSFGSPVTTSGNITQTLLTQTTNKVFAAPNGSTGQPSFRVLVGADIPAINLAGTGNGGITGNLPFANLTITSTNVVGLFSGGAGCTGTNALAANGTCVSITGTSGANPTASVGTSAVNGTATTFMRSDGAPAISTTMSPTMTGNWTHSPSSGVGITVNGSGTNAGISIVGAASNAAYFGLTDGNTGNTVWQLRNGWSTTGVFTIYNVTSGHDAMDLVPGGNFTFFAGTAGVPTISIGAPSGGGITADVACVLTSTQSCSYWIGTALTTGASGGMLWNNNSGTPYLSIETFANGAPIRIGAGASAVLLPSIGSTTAAQSGAVCLGSGGNLTFDPTNTCITSSIRYKQNIEPLNEGLDAVMRLRPVTYEYKPGYLKTDIGRQVGFVAEDVQKIDPLLTPLDATGQPRGVEYAQMTALLARAIQDQQHEIDALKRHQRKH
jgi:hypothetical protein